MVSGRHLTILCLLLFAAGVSAEGTKDDEWFDDDLEEQVANVNAGNLVFLDEPPADPVHHHYNRIVLDAESLVNGWVSVVQCHSQLDAVSRTQVLFHETRARDLVILSYDNIHSAWIEGHTVQMEDVKRDASICIQVEMRTLESNEDGSFSLHSGPFMRRFLDGYYPMRVSIDIEVPRDHLRFLDIRPQRQAGFSVRETAKGVYVDTWFEGKLYTEVRFETGF
jgi:hypothetical protein